MNAEEKFELIKKEYEKKMSAAISRIEKENYSGKLDNGNPEISSIWYWFLDEAKKILKEEK